MKKLLLLIFVFIFHSVVVSAQTSFSCTYRQYCKWNKYLEKFEDCQGYEESSLFVMNKNETMFTHTIETMKSTYYVNSSEYDKEKDVWSYYVTSDVGNKYLYVFDPKNLEIRVLFKQDGEPVMLTFDVKAIF
ncbi:MAG: hypothetical protein FGM54_05420 [Chitinophagaceae bacterium]|nr:hypothetical protein [Chitinophagaceae bacterium]